MNESDKRRLQPHPRPQLRAEAVDKDVHLVILLEHETRLVVTPDEAMLLGFNLQQAAARLKETL